MQYQLRGSNYMSCFLDRYSPQLQRFQLSDDLPYSRQLHQDVSDLFLGVALE